jgi:hypothetical protein
MSAPRRLLMRNAQVVKVVELRCPRCQRGLLLSEGEAIPPKPGQVPYCGDCLEGGERIQMVRREFRSGPTDLHV